MFFPFASVLLDFVCLLLLWLLLLGSEMLIVLPSKIDAFGAGEDARDKCLGRSIPGLINADLVGRAGYLGKG